MDLELRSVPVEAKLAGEAESIGAGAVNEVTVRPRRWFTVQLADASSLGSVRAQSRDDAMRRLVEVLRDDKLRLLFRPGTSVTRGRLEDHPR